MPSVVTSSCGRRSLSNIDSQVRNLAAVLRDRRFFLGVRVDYWQSWAGKRVNAIGKELWAQLPVSPDAYPQKLDLIRGLVLVIRLDAGAYRSASFLDDRIIAPSTQGVWFPLARVTEAAATHHRPAPASLHLPHRACRLDAGEPPA